MASRLLTLTIISIYFSVLNIARSEDLKVEIGKNAYLMSKTLRPDLPREFCRGGVEDTIIHSIKVRGEATYLLFHQEGWSRSRAIDRGNCGCGWEKQINWIKIVNGRIVDRQLYDLRSCWRIAGGTIEGWKDGKLFLAVSNYEETPFERRVFFDSEAPDKGFQIIETSKPK